MPHAPSELTVLQSAREDLETIQQHNPDHAERILKKINDWTEKITWGRIP
jgi:mRNA interferase RelE/StbE